MSGRKIIIQIICLLAILGMVGCAGAPQTPQRQSSDWPLSAPEQHGMDSARLDQMLAYIEEHNLPITSVLVVRNGNLVLEAYPQSYAGPEVKRKLYSATKSFTSALIGIAIREGFIESVDQKVLDFFPERTVTNLDEGKRDITIEHLLTMTPGYQWNMGDGGRMRESQDPVQYVLDKPMVASPGEVYNYGDGASLLLSAILTQATGRTALEFAREYLFNPLGITDVEWEAKSGVNFGGSGLHLTPRDMAKFGILYLNQGRWGKEQIVPAAWVTRSTEAHFSGAGYIAEKQAYIDGYGYQWWCWPYSGVFYASGMYEQKIYVIPALDMVVVFTANNSGQDITYGLVSHFIYPAIEELPVSRYAKYRFSFEYPYGMAMRELPIAGQNAISEASGTVEFRFDYPFFEYIAIIWSASDQAPDLEKLLEEVYASSQLEFTQKAPLARAQKDQRELVYQSFELNDQGLELRGMAGAWYNRQQKRVYVLAYATLPEQAADLDVLEIFLSYLESFSEQ